MDYGQIALEYAEKYGIIDYKVKGSTMIYYEKFYDGTYEVLVDLNTLKETRTNIN